MTDGKPWYQSARGITVVAVYAALTLVGLAISTAPEAAEPLVFQNATAEGAAELPASAVPPIVYLYAFLGAMAYAFTSVVAKFERDTREVVKVGLRALAALPLAAGVFVLAGALGVEGAPVAGVAFLVGLYVNLTLKSLGGLAERLYGPGEDDDAEEDSEGDSEEE